MLEILQSHWIVIVILLQKYFDMLHQLIMGIPTLKRSQISANLFLGGQYSLMGLEKLRRMGITAIISMRENSIYEEAHYEGFSFLHLPTADNTPPKLEDLIKGAKFADAVIKEKGKVYIHCRQGLGRGPSMAIAYLLKLGTTFDDAFALVKNVRPFINPRPLQIARLRELEDYYKEQTAKAKLEIVSD